VGEGMKYMVYSGFEIPKRSNGLGSFDKQFWDQVDTEKDGLSMQAANSYNHADRFCSKKKCLQKRGEKEEKVIRQQTR
jgi:hypothetical protein